MNTIYFNEVSRKTFVHDCMPTAHYFIKTTSLPRLFIIYLFYVFAPLKKKHSNFISALLSLMLVSYALKDQYNAKIYVNFHFIYCKIPFKMNNNMLSPSVNFSSCSKDTFVLSKCKLYIYILLYHLLH